MSSSPAPHPREPASADRLDALTAELLNWLVTGPRPYREVMDAWRTACPRLTIWEDALDAGLIARARETGGEAMVCVTPRGRVLLAERASRP